MFSIEVVTSSLHEIILELFYYTLNVRKSLAKIDNFLTQISG